MDTLFITSIYSNTFYFQRLILNFTDRINLKKNDIYFALLNLSINRIWEMEKMYLI